MRKYLLLILSFVFQFCVISATNYTYRYWIDENTNAMTTRTCASNNIDFEIDVSSLSCDMHTLFIQAKKDNANWSNPLARPFLVTNKYGTVKTYYWFDDNDNTSFEHTRVNGEAIMIDVSHLSDGIHTFNAIMKDEYNNTSVNVTRSFVKLTNIDANAYYWFDNDMTYQELTKINGDVVLLDVSHLDAGVHTFNVMLKSNKENITNIVSYPFIKTANLLENADITLKFWIDGEFYAQKHYSNLEELVSFNFDVNDFSIGMHYLQVQAVTNSGSMSNIASGYFMRMPDEKNEGVMAYRYWVNDDNANSTFTMVENTALPYEFIGDLDVAPQPLRCARFHFEVNDDKPMLYAVNDLTVQFFSVGGHLINAKKEFIEGVAADTLTADEWTVINNDTVIKANTPKDETIYWYAMNLEEGDTVCIKTNYSSTLQVFSHSGNKVFESKTDSSLVFRQFVADKAEAYYLALHTVNTTKAQVTLTVDLKEFIRYFNVETSAIGGGTVTAGGIYPESTELTLTATPSEGYHFVKWSDGITEATRTIVVASDMALSAEFAINVYTIAVSAENGTITGAGEYEHGTEATLNATPNAGYHFVKWSDGVTDATRTIVVTSDMALSAEFAINVYNVTLSAENGVVIGAGEYNHGTEVTLTATPAEGYHFVKWSDGITDTTRTIIVTSNVALSAEFAINVYTVAVSAENGTVTGAGEYNHGTEVTLVATPAEGYHFVKWSDGVADATRTITVNSNLTLSAELAINIYTVTLIAENGVVTGAGKYEHGTEVTLTVTPNEGYNFVKWSDGNPNLSRQIVVTEDITLSTEFALNIYNIAASAVNGTVTGAGQYQHGQIVTLVAQANANCHFIGWSDGVMDLTRTFVAAKDMTLTAYFASDKYLVMLSAENGTVTGAGEYEHGTTISISATPAEGYHFVKWSDGNTNATRSIVVTSNVTLTAEFAINIYTVNVTTVNGTIIGTGEYQHGATATLTAVATTGYHFVRWSDGVTDATRSIVVKSNVTLTAEFAINVYNVTLSAVNGTVTGAGEYQHGQTANISATPAEGYHLVKWSDGNTNATRSIVVTSNVTLTAEFAINVYNVTLSAVNGTVTGAGEYQHGATATITAVAAEGYHFVKWSDGVTETTRSFVMTSDVTLTAEFAINVYTISATAVNGTVTGAGEYQHGQTVTLTAVANPNCHFLGWSDGVMDLTRTFVATKDASFSAYFASDKYLVVLSAENGTVTGTGEYEHGTTINISATPAEGYHFVKWSDGDTNATRAIVVTENVSLTAEFAINVYTVDVTAVNGSIIGDGEYQHGATATLTAVVAEGYHFVRWSDGVTDATRSIVVTANVTLTAEFAINVYNVTLSAVNGTVTGAGEYQHGATANITATPAEGYHFVKWSDGDTNATRAIVVTEDVTLTAEFAINVYNVTLSTINGTVTGAGKYEHGATATIIATPAEGYHFVKWSDGNTDATRAIVVTSNINLTAEFAINVYKIEATAVNGTVTGAGEYEHGATATIIATPAEGYHFVKWSDDNTDATRSIVVTSNINFTAEFAINVYNVTLSAVNGTVTGAGEYNHGATATITAIAAEGYHFVRWSDGNTEATRAIMVTNNITLTAEFAINVYTIAVTAVNGTVTGAGEYQHGATIVLTAIANTGYRFVRWSDGVTESTRTFVAKENMNLTAEFTTDSYNVVLTTNDVMGRVIGSGTYAYGTTITIVAIPNAHYHFVKWSDGDTNDVRTIIVTEDVTLSAEFVANMYELTLIADENTGRVIGAGTYNYGTEVTIVAIANSGYKFSQWSDGDKNDVRTITISDNITLTAEFAAINVDVENIEENSIIAYSQNQTLYIEGIEGNYYLLDSTGKIIYHGDSHVVTLPCGVYIISTGEMYQKVIIRK